MLTPDDTATLDRLGIMVDSDDDFWLVPTGSDDTYGSESWLAISCRDRSRVDLDDSIQTWRVPAEAQGRWVLMQPYSFAHDPPGRQYVGWFDTLEALIGYAALQGLEPGPVRDAWERGDIDAVTWADPKTSNTQS